MLIMKKGAKDSYIYPAVFTYEEGLIAVEFPDLPGCVTFGADDEDALYMAKDALRGYLLVAEDFGDDIPNPSKLNSVFLADNQRAVLIEVCLAIYRKAYKNRAVKKTLTIPAWLNELAEKENINFSFTLQQAIKEQLKIKA